MMSRKLKLVIAGTATILVVGAILVGTAMAQPPTPNSPNPPAREELTTWMRGMMDGMHGAGSYDEMVEWMDEVHDPGTHDQMLDWMSQGGGCGGFGTGDGQTGGTSTQGFGGMMGGGF